MKKERICLNCDSTATYIDPNGHTRWQCVENGYLCHRCAGILIWSPKRTKEQIKRANDKRTKEYRKKYADIESPKRIGFKNKRISLKYNPRTGVCSICRAQCTTHMHHLNYHEDEPLKDTVELCASCHMKEHKDKK